MSDIKFLLIFNANYFNAKIVKLKLHMNYPDS